MLAEDDSTSELALEPKERASLVFQLITALDEMSMAPTRDSRFQPYINKVVLVAVGVVAEMLIPPPVVAIDASVNGLLASL